MEEYEIVSNHSYDEEAGYSDQIDSDIEAELYGLIHHDTQDKSISLEDNSVPLENQSVSLHSQSDSSENISVLLQNNLDSTTNNSVSLPTTSAVSENKINSAKKLKTSIERSSKIHSTNHNNVFCSDTIVNNNLYYSFESPNRKRKIQSNQGQSESSKRNTIDTPKRKSEVVVEILGTIQQKKNTKSILPDNSISKQKKNNQHHNSILDEEISFVEVIDDSSESDSDNSIIFFEPDPSNLQTNIAKETVILSSDAEESDSSIEKSLSQACERNRTVTTTANFSPNNKDPWHINSEDRFRTKKQSNRYHENAVLTCSKCLLKGHSAKFCTVPKAMKCFFCGDFHAGANCKNKICTKCFQQGHDRRRCFIRYIDTCELCRMKGHSQRNCPDLWRRYHLTTSKGAIVKANPNPHSPLYCYNCGARGHYGAECLENRTDRWSFATWTSVVSYKNPISVLRGEEERNFQGRKRFDETPLFHRRKRYERLPNETPRHIQILKNKKKKKKKSPIAQQNANHQSPISPKNTVQKEVYFPRTPKVTPNSSIARLSKKKWKKRNKEDGRTREQVLHHIGLQQRLGLAFPSTV